MNVDFPDHPVCFFLGKSSGMPDNVPYITGKKFLKNKMWVRRYMGTSEVRRKSVLVVDDELDILRAASFVLGKAGYEVSTAQEGQEALDLVKEKRFDLILLDVVMPGLDGFSFLKVMRSDIATRNVPILVVSGRSGMSDTFLSFGADGFVVKPMEPAALITEAEKFTKDRVLLLTGSPFVGEKISRIFKRENYDICTAENEEELQAKGKESRYKCVVAHLASISSSPEKFKEMIAEKLMYKDPALVLYSDSSVKGLENNSTVNIEREITKWTRAGVKYFYDPRVTIKPFSYLLRSWVFEN
jgi:CheY-like chemotaxis protein